MARSIRELLVQVNTLRLYISTRIQQIDSDDRGSITVEKAILTAIGVGLALALGTVITSVVHKYMAQIK